MCIRRHPLIYFIALLAAFLLSSCGVMTAGPTPTTDLPSASPTPDANLVAGNIKYGVSISGIMGSYRGSFSLAMGSSANRNPGSVFSGVNFLSSSQILVFDESSYAGQALPSLPGTYYRDIPNLDLDSDGLTGIFCQYVRRPSVNCGLTQSTLAARILDCATVNNTIAGTTATWDGSSKCNSGQGLWKLVTRSAANQEVWQDTRTGLLWSSMVSSGTNWCQATGNIQDSFLGFFKSYHNAEGTPMVGSGKVTGLQGGASSINESVTINFVSAASFSITSSGGASGCQGSFSVVGGLTATPGSSVTWSKSGVCSIDVVQGITLFQSGDVFILRSNGNLLSCLPGSSSLLQPVSPISYCAEATGHNPPSGESWTSVGYSSAKGGLGKLTSPAVAWRTPTLNDWRVADINGIRFVMPDMGIPGVERNFNDSSLGGGPEWTATPYGRGGAVNLFGEKAWTYDSLDGVSTSVSRGLSSRVRCVGR